MKLIKNLYNSMKRDFLGDSAEVIPEEFWSQFICVGGASEVQYQIGRIIPAKPKQKILIIGIFGGRDYFYLKSQGHEVFALDIFDDKRFNNLEVGDVQNKLPWPDEFFDVIIASEIIEHVPRDYDALLNIRKVLKNDGVFIMTIPFSLFRDTEQTHIHVYNKIFIERLLNASGFKIEEIFERPNLFFAPGVINFLHHGANALSYFLFKKTFYKRTLPILWKLEYWLAKKKFILRRYFFRYGAVLACRKTKNIFDFVEFNKKKFSK